MPGPPTGPGPKEALREAAAEWVIRMRGPDAERARPAFEAWLAEHPDHKRMYDRVAVSWEQSRLVAHTPAGKAWEGLPARARPARRTWAYAVAAGIAALVVVGLLLAHRSPVAGPGAPAQEIASQIGIRHVRLADGTIVTLDAETRLALRFSAGERRILLKAGRARFAVAHDASRPFVVAAADREIVATGTIFDVSCANDTVSVALLRGGVDVREARPNGPHPLVARLAPGQAIQLAPGVEPVAHPLDTGAEDWPNGMVEFDGTPLRDVIATANRYSRRHIVLADPALGELKVTGGFRLGDPEGFAAALAAAFELETRPVKESILIDRRGSVQ